MANQVPNHKLKDMQTQKITLALVAARKNSKGVRNKNLLKIKNKTITRIAVEISIKSSKIDKVILSSDGNKILNSVPNHKKLIKLKRRESLSKDGTPMLPVMKNAINYLERTSKKKFNVTSLIIIDPTAPLRKISDINNSIKLFNKKKPDLLISAHEGQHNPYFSMIEKKGKFFNLCKSLKNKDFGSRQEAPKVFEINTIVWIYSRKAIFKINKRIPKKTILFTTPISRSIDIDNENDIRLLNFYTKSKKREIKYA